MMLSSRDLRALAVGGVTVASALASVFVILPAARAIGDAHRTVATERLLLERERQVIARAEVTDSALAHAVRELAAIAFVISDAAEPALATRDLASMLETVATLSGIADVRTEPLGIESVNEELSRVRVRVSGVASYRNALLLLHRVEAAPEMLRVEQIALRAGEKSPAAAVEPVVSLTMIVQAPALPDRARILATWQAAPRLRQPAGMRSETELLASITDDPFHPGAEAATAFDDGEIQPTTSRPALTLVGTVVLPGSKGVAMVSLGTDSPRVVRIGDRIGSLRLRGIEPGAAEFEDESGTRITVRVPKPGA